MVNVRLPVICLFITMTEQINEKISVITVYNRESGMVMPRKIRWQGRIYTMTKLAYHHKIRQGRTIMHIFHVTNGSIDFRINLNTENLHWTLEEIYDGTSS